MTNPEQNLKVTTTVEVSLIALKQKQPSTAIHLEPCIFRLRLPQTQHNLTWESLDKNSSVISDSGQIQMGFNSHRVQAVLCVFLKD